jgi:predicted transcriptional regulator
MTQEAQSQPRQQRVALGAFIDSEQHRELVDLARREDRSVSSIVRRALRAELEQRGRTS